MITRIEVDNFKALCDFQVDLNPVNVFIGSNAVGKSSILQVISLLRHVANNTIDQFLSERKWEGSELKSKLYEKQKQLLKFKIWFKLGDFELLWYFSLKTKGKNLILSNERVEDSEYLYMHRTPKEMWWLDSDVGEKVKIPKIHLDGSILSLVDVEDPVDRVRLPELFAIKEFLDGIESFELLTPEKMRKSTNKESALLGTGGERLASFIHGLSSEKKDGLREQFQKFYPYAEKVKAVRKRAGWVDLSVQESIREGESFDVNVKYMSDGLLRILFFSAIGALGDEHTALLLDEIEDGISPDLAAILVKSLTSISSEHNKQFFVTTHSPLVLDYFESDSVLFLYRNDEGHVKASRVFEVDKVKQHLSFMNLGEVWASYGHEKLTEIIQESEQEEADDADDQDTHSG